MEDSVILMQYFRFLEFLIYVFMVGYILYKNPKSLLNITCALLISTFAIWTIADPDSLGNNITKETAILFQNISSIGWISLASFYICFAMVFSKRKKLLKIKWFLGLIFILPVILLYQEWTVGLSSPILGDSGWYFSWKESFWTYLFYAYYITFMLIGIYIIYRHGTQTKQIIEKKQSKIIVATVFISLIGGTITDVFMAIPQIGNFFLFVFAGGCIYAVVKYEFLAISLTLAAENIISTMTELMILIDREGNIINVNKAVTDTLKFDQKELSGKSIATLLSYKHLTITILEKIIQGEIIKNHDAYLLVKDSGEIPVIFSCSPLKDKKGEMRGIVFVASDITVRKQSEDVLAQERYLMNALMNNLPDYIYFKDKESRFIKISNSHAHSFELGVPAEAIGKTDFDFFSEEHALQAYNDEQEIIRSGKPLVKEEKETWPDRPDTWVSTTKLPLLNQDGEIVGTFGVSKDITERIRSEEAIIESDRLLHESQEIAGLGSYAWDITKGLWTSSKILDRIFGIDERYVRSLESWLAIIHPNFRELMQNYITDEVLGKQQKFDKEYQIINQENGQECWVHGLGRLEFDSNHQPIKLIGTIQDITERKLSEETINNSKSKLSLALKIAHLGAWEYDVADDIFTFNDSFYAIFRTNTDQVGGNTMSSADYANRFVYPEDLSIVGDEIRMAIETDNPDYFRQFEHRIIYADEEIGYIAVLFATVKDENERTVKIFGINQDITERKKAENEILINSKRLNALVEILQYPSYSMQDYLDFALNKAIEMTDSRIGFIFFYNEEKKEFVLNSWSNEVMKECAIAEKQTIWQLENAGLWGEAVRQRKPIVANDYQMPNPLKKGLPEGHALLHKFLIIPMLENDKIVGVVAVANKKTDYLDADIMQLTVLMDIVWKALDKKKSDTELFESEEKLSTLFASMTEMVTTHKLIFNENGDAVNYQITDCNDSFTTMTGIKKEDAIGKLVTEVYQTDTPPHLEEFAKVALTGKPYEFTDYNADIDKYLMVSVFSPSKSKFSTIVTDITVIQKIQEEIKDKNKELENYLYVASHDLRSPLVNIQGFSQRFKKQSDTLKNAIDQCPLETEIKHGLDKLTNEDIPKTLNFILSNVTKMETLISGLLQISRTGRVVMTIKKVNMTHLIKTIIAGNNFQITELSAKVIIEDLPECYGDENLLNQLFANIISNALKYRDPNRQLVIEVDSHAQFNKVIYSIKDTGIGIEARHLEKIWDVFYRVDPGSEVQGDGIGLNVVKRIVEKHKGKIWVESEVGKGSVFYIELQKNEFVE